MIYNLVIAVALLSVSNSVSLTINLTTPLIPSQGFMLNAGIGDYGIGSPTQNIGDINHDGIDDFIIVSEREVAYVVYGQPNKTTANVNLTALTSDQGFTITGVTDSDFGHAVSPAGDVNKDGVDDFMISARNLAYNDTLESGGVYVFYGRKDGSFSNINLTQGLHLSQGFLIQSQMSEVYLGHSLSAVGDVNNDGFDDIAVGSHLYGPTGAVYIIYGSHTPQNIIVELITPSQGFQINPPAQQNIQFGTSIGSGDFNNDTLTDIIISAPWMDANNTYRAGVVYVIYGSRDGIADVNLANLTRDQGFQISGFQSHGNIGNIVGNAGDLNNDGIADILVCMSDFTIGTAQSPGAVYIIYGQNGTRADTINLAELNSSQGFYVRPDNDARDMYFASFGCSVSRAGDVNHDGVDDLVIGVPFLVNTSQYHDYDCMIIVIYGKHGGGISPIVFKNTLNITQGFTIIAYNRTLLGRSISSGDINGDGFADILLSAPNLRTQDSPTGAVIVIHFDCLTAHCDQCYGQDCVVCKPGYVLNPLNKKCDLIHEEGEEQESAGRLEAIII